MSNNPPRIDGGVSQRDVAPQQRGPRPLAGFLAMAMEVTGGDRARMAKVLAGVRAYQASPYTRALPTPPSVAAAGSARLLDYGGGGPPLVVVPSLINPPHVLDLAESNSLLRWLAQHGLRPLLVDWGEPGTAEAGLSIDGYVEERLVPLIDSLGEPAALAGYCLGGTMAIAAAAMRAPSRLALIATPWTFEGYEPERREAVLAYWRQAAPGAEALGALPMEMLQPMFWQLDPEGSAGKFERLADGQAGPGFAALEDWANDGPPLTLPVARQLFEDFYGRDLPGSGAWRGLDPAALGMPVLNLVSSRDRIVPAAAAPRVGTRRDIDAGHVGMITGSRARGAVWEPLRDFLLA